MGEMVNKCKLGDVCLDNRIHTVNDAGHITSKHMPEHETATTLDSGSGEERNKNNQPSDDWFPITQSRRGNSWTATFHLLSSGIGIQTLSLPLAFVYMGW